MIVDYNYKPQAQYIKNTSSSFTITADKGNKGFIYVKGIDDLGDVLPFVNFYGPDGSLVGITLGLPSGSINDCYLAQFKIDDSLNSRFTDINFPAQVGAGGEQDSIFLPIKFHSMIFTVDVSGSGEYIEMPLLITLY